MEELPKITVKSESAVIPKQGEAEKAAKKTIGEIEIDDHRWRLQARKWYGGIFIGLLIAQNIAVGLLFGNAYLNGKLEALASSLTVVLSGTLIETAYIIRIIVQWVFSNIDYKK